MSIRNEKYILILILFFGFMLRAVSINYGLPNPGYFSSDEIDAVSRAVKIGAGDLTPSHFNKPTFYNIMILVFNFFAFVIYRIIGANTDFKRLFIQNPAFFYIPARLVSVCAGTATIYLCYLIGKKLKDARAGLTAAFLLSCCYTTIRFSHYAKEDALLTLFVVLTFVVALKIRDSISAHYVFISGIITGLAAAAKYTGILAIIFPLYYMIKNKNLKTQTNLALFGGLLFGFAIGMPYFIVHPVDFFKGLMSSTILRQVQGETIWLGGEEHFGLTFTMKLFFQEFGYIFFAALIISLFHSIVWGGKLSVRTLVKNPLAPFIITYMLILIFTGHLDYHYIMPLTPFLCLAVAIYLANIKAKGVYALLIILMIGEPLHRAVKFDMESLGEDSRITAARWIETNIPAKDKIVFDTAYYYQYHPPVGISKESVVLLISQAKEQGGSGNYYKLLGEFQEKSHYYNAQFLSMPTWLEKMPQSDIRAYNLEFLMREGAMWLVCSSYYYDRILRDKNTGWKPLKDFYMGLNGREYQTFQPKPWANMGPVINIYRIGDEQNQR